MNDRITTAKPAQPSRPPIGRRADYLHWLVMPTRWMDNDGLGHVNNVVYYSWIDTAINRYLLDTGGYDARTSPLLAFAIESQCRYHKSFTYPEDVHAGLRVARLGTTSVRYEVGLFATGEEEARAEGYFVHVFVDRVHNRPTAMTADLRAVLARIAVG